MRTSQEQSLFDNEQAKLNSLFDTYPENERHRIFTQDGMEFIACEKPNPDHQSILIAGITAMEQRFEKDVITQAFKGVKIYLANGIASGGGEALPRVDTIILSAENMGMNVAQMEAIASEAGMYRVGDQSDVFGADADASEVGFVHELGHILEYRAHLEMDVGFQTLDSLKSPTWYGQQKPREDYAESWMFMVYGHSIDQDREAILQADLKKVAAANESRL